MQSVYAYAQILYMCTYIFEALAAWKASGCDETDELFESVLPFLGDDLRIPHSQVGNMAREIYDGLEPRMARTFLTGDKHVSTHSFWSAFDGSHILGKKWHH